MAPARSEIDGLVLAGGRGQRLGGVDKGWIEVDGRPLIEIACERLRPQVARLAISANRNLERYSRIAAVVRDAGDADTFAGPLAGIGAALAAGERDWLAIVPCDAPRFPADLVARLAQAVGDADAACASAAGRLQPLFALIHRRARPALDAALARGERRATEWMIAVGAVAVPFGDDAAFANLNTADDLARARHAFAGTR